jgi:CheY-specific phosphatase CheX
VFSANRRNAPSKSADRHSWANSRLLDLALFLLPMSSNSIEPEIVTPRHHWPAVLQETVVEVFSTMAGASVSVAPSVAPLATAQFTGLVGIAGAIRATFLLQCNQAASHKLAAQMLGVVPEDPACQKASADALGEICNIIAGYFKAKVGLGDTCMLSVPTIIVGRNYQFHSAKMFERLELAVSYEGEALFATLEIAR